MQTIHDGKEKAGWMSCSELHRILLSNQTVTEIENRQVLETGSWISMLLLGSMILIASDLLWYDMLLTYCTFTVVSFLALAFCLFVMPELSVSHSILPVLYFYLFLMILLSVYISFSIASGRSLLMFSGCLLLFPLLILDEQYRVAVFLLVMDGLYFFCIWRFSPFQGRLLDIVSCAGVMAGSLMLERWISGLRLGSIDRKRILRQQTQILHYDELKYARAMKAAKLSVWEFDVQGRKIILPQESEFEYIRYETGVPGDVIENVPDVLFEKCETKEDIDILRNIYEDIFRGKGSTEGVIWYHSTPDSQPRCIRISYSVSCDENGVPVRAFGSSQDITNQEVEKKRYSEAIRNMIHTNPRAMNIARLNLTENVCGEGHGVTESIMKRLHGGTVDDLFAHIADLISTDEDRCKFKIIFDRKNLIRSFERGVQHGSVSYRRETENGKIRWVKSYVNMVRNPETGNVEAVIYAEDIDEIKKGEQMIQRITDEEFDYISLLYAPDQKYIFYHVSESMRKDFETLTYEIGEPRNLEEVCREAAGNWIHPDERDRFLAEVSLDYVREQLGSADGFTRRYKGVKKDGTSCWKQIKMSYMDELMDWIMVEQTDITKEARIQKMLENQLEREKELRQRADRANEMKTGFLASVSHDMRTPLNAVLGYAALADEGSDLKNIKDYLSKIQTAGNMLLLLINDTLDLQKMESGIVTLKPEPVRIRELVESVVTAVQPDMDKKKIVFQVSTVYEDDRYVAADLIRVEKILINLLANAVKYTPEQGTVLFHAETRCKTSDTVLFHAKVRDNGLGISKGFLPRIYEPFSQERTEETEHIDGSGLGLSIVKRLVDLMGGTITVSSELGKGTEFCVELDFPRMLTETIPVRQPENKDERILEGKKVLLCEDNLMNQEIMEAMLKKYGLEVICASNGKDGTAFFEKSAPGEFGAILMDIHMPVMDGYQATEKIRNSRHPDAQKIPIIAMTADAYQEDVQKAFEMGMNAHLAKPVNPKLLYLELKKQITY